VDPPLGGKFQPGYASSRVRGEQSHKLGGGGAVFPPFGAPSRSAEAPLALALEGPARRPAVGRGHEPNLSVEDLGAFRDTDLTDDESSVVRDDPDLAVVSAAEGTRDVAVVRWILHGGEATRGVLAPPRPCARSVLLARATRAPARARCGARVQRPQSPRGRPSRSPGRSGGWASAQPSRFPRRND
jgi:hypothetical protein